MPSFRDAQNTYSLDQAITATAASTNVLQKAGGSQGFGLGGRQLWVFNQVTEAFNNLTSLKLAHQCDDNAAFSSATELSSVTPLLAALTLGAVFPLAIPLTGVELYTRMYYTVTGTAPTTGKITSYIVDQLDYFNTVSLP